MHRSFVNNRDLRRADRRVIAEFASDSVTTRNWHSAVGAVGLGAKYAAETFLGVQYRRGIERGLPAAVKTAAKVVVGCQPPVLKGAVKKTAVKIKDVTEELKDQMRQQQKIEEAKSRRHQYEKQAEYEATQHRREQEWASYGLQRVA